MHDPSRESDMLIALEANLRQRAHRGETVALIIDEAQNLSEEMLERLRILSNLESTETKLLQIVLVGQPELGRRLHRFDLRQLNERVSVRAYLKPLPRRELRAYVQHRMQRAGGDLRALTTPLARWLLLRRAWGIPRRVNILFHNALLYAFGRGAHRLTARVALAAISEMNDRPLRRLFLSVVRRPAWGVAAAAAVLLLALLVDRYVGRTAPVAPVATLDVPPAATVDVPPVAAPAPPPPPPIEVGAAPPMPPDGSPPGADVANQPPDPPPPPATEPVATRPAACEPRVVQITAGATLSSIAREVYGYLPTGEEYARFMGGVKALNPWITDPDLIFPDRPLRLPVDVASDAGDVPSAE
jgi:hypothetical protein